MVGRSVGRPVGRFLKIIIPLFIFQSTLIFALVFIYEVVFIYEIVYIFEAVFNFGVILVSGSSAIFVSCFLGGPYFWNCLHVLGHVHF